MQVHGLTEVLTFDKTGFSRFAGIRVVDPAEVHPAETQPGEPEPSEPQGAE